MIRTIPAGFYILFGLSLLYLNSLPGISGDSGFWTRFGIHFLETGSILKQDIFSVLPTTKMITPSWGAGVLYAFLYKFGDMFAINLFHKIFFMVFVILTGREIFKDGEMRLRDLIIFGVLFYNSFFYLDKPAQLAILPFFLFLKLNLNSSNSFNKKLVLSSLLTIFWVNIHISALIAPLLFYVLNTNKFEAKLLLWSLVPLFLLNINPFGVDIFKHAFETSLLSRERLLIDWEPVASKSFPLQSIIFFTSIGMIFNKYSSKRSKPPLWLFFLLMLGVTGVRQTVWVSYALAFWFKKSGPENRKFPLGNPVILITLNFLAIFSLFPEGKKYVGENKLLSMNTVAPQTLVEKIIETGEKGPIFNDIKFGSYFILKLQNKIFMDFRNSIFSDEAFKEYDQVVTAKEGWESVLDKYGIKLIALPLGRNRIKATLATSANWEVIFTDKDYFLARRK